MLYSEILNSVRKHLAGELVSENEIINFADRTIDDLNVQLNSAFPVLSEFKKYYKDIPAEELDYNLIPDKYIRTVVIPGTAFKYYTADEEGSITAQKYEEDYRQGLFYMLRDFSFQIPNAFRAENQGFVQNDDADAGITVMPYRGIF